MLKEEEIRLLIPKILQEVGGIASKQQIAEYIEQNCDLDADQDSSISNSRNEKKYVQRIGNIISHTKKTGCEYIEFAEGFAIVKKKVYPRKEMWMFVLPDKYRATAVSHEGSFEDFENDISQSDNVKSQDESKISETNVIPRKYDWDTISAKRAEIGNAGEKFVFEMEKAYVVENCPSETDRVIWSSREEGDGCGYDIQSVYHEDHAKDLLIEVKTTNSRSRNMDFSMTRHEKDFFENHKDPNKILQIYRLYNPNDDMSHFDYIVIPQKDVIALYKPIPESYKMKFVG